MFYREFLKITDILDERFVEAFDFWLTTLPEYDAKTISITTIASRLDVKYSLAETIVKFAEKEGILKKRYIVLCSNDECGFFYDEYNADELIALLGTEGYCHNCGKEFTISYENTMVVYSKIREPNVPESAIEEEIKKRVGKINGNINFFNADTLAQNPKDIFDLYYSPSESAYKKLVELKAALNGPFKTTKEKGDVLEALALYLFKQIRSVKGTNRIKTYTNQFDCTMCFSYTSKTFPTIMRYMTPYFIIECKNEMEKSGKGKTPSNTYYHKLSDIMSSNDAQLGIVLSRGEASEEDIRIAHDNYLLSKSTTQQKIMLSLSEHDLEALIDKRINLLEYLSFKKDVLTMNAKNATFEMFEDSVA